MISVDSRTFGASVIAGIRAHIDPGRDTVGADEPLGDIADGDLRDALHMAVTIAAAATGRINELDPHAGDRGLANIALAVAREDVGV